MDKTVNKNRMPTEQPNRWERGPNPWHSDAFKGLGKQIEDQTSHSPTERKEGWFEIDSFGNMIGFIIDGTKIEGK